MLAECMMKKSKGVMDAKQQGDCLGVMTRSRIRALQRGNKDGGEFRKLDKLGVGSPQAKKRQRRGVSSTSGKGKGKGKGKKLKVDKDEEKEKDKEKGGGGLEEGLDDMGGVDFVESGDLDGIGGGSSGLGEGSAEVATNADGVADFVMDAMMVGAGDAVIDTAFAGVFAAQEGGVDGAAANADGVHDSLIAAAADDAIVAGGGDALNAGGGDAVSGGVDAAVAKAADDGTAAVSYGGGGGGAELGGDVAGDNDRVIRESTPEHLIMRSDYITTPCSSMKDVKAVADERPQTEVGGNLHQHMKLTTDLLLQDNSNYAPSMEKYNFDFENEKPLFGRYEWEKVQP